MTLRSAGLLAVASLATCTLLERKRASLWCLSKSCTKGSSSKGKCNTSYFGKLRSRVTCVTPTLCSFMAFSMMRIRSTWSLNTVLRVSFTRIWRANLWVVTQSSNRLATYFKCARPSSTFTRRISFIGTSSRRIYLIVLALSSLLTSAGLCMPPRTEGRQCVALLTTCLRKCSARKIESRTITTRRLTYGLWASLLMSLSSVSLLSRQAVIERHTKGFVSLTTAFLKALVLTSRPSSTRVCKARQIKDQVLKSLRITDGSPRTYQESRSRSIVSMLRCSGEVTEVKYSR